MIQRCVVTVLICLWCGFHGCATIPRESSLHEVQEAESVLLNAKKIEAPVYAPERYLEARLTLRKAKRMMSLEKFRDAKSLAQKAQRTAQESFDESVQERMRVKALAERLLYRGEEIWNRFEKGDEKTYVPETLIAIKKLLDDGHSQLRREQFMDALGAAQSAHQQLAELPEIIESAKVARLEKEKNRLSSEKNARQIIESAQKEAAAIIEQARAKAASIEQEIKLKVGRAMLDEFDRLYPSTYRVKQGETLIDIAGRREIFNDRFMWPLIYKANRDQIRDPEVVFPGQTLAIPRNITFEEIIEARKQAEASPPYIPPRDAYNPQIYRNFLSLLPEGQGAAAVPEGGEAP